MSRSILLLSALLCVASAHADTIRIRSDDWFPYNGDPASAQPGYMIELARIIAERNGDQIDYRLLSWEESIAATRAGTADCVVGALHGDAPDFRFPTASWGRSADAFFVMDSNPWRLRTIEDLASVRLAVIEGYEYTEDTQAYIESAPPERLYKIENTRNGLSKALMLLVTRRVDVVVEDANVGAAKIARMGLTGRVVRAGVAGKPEDIFIACTPARPEGEAWADMFGKGIEELRRAGELNPVLSRYGLSDWAQ